MTDDDRGVMLAKVGVSSVDALYNDVPVKAPVDLRRWSWAGLSHSSIQDKRVVHGDVSRRGGEGSRS
jgi:hypothetical protein